MVNWEEMLDPLGKYYILLKESTGKRYEKKNFLKKLMPPYVDQPNSDFNADIGTLYEKAPNEKQPNNKSMIGLVSIEKSDSYIFSLDVQLSDVIDINFKELKLLLAVSLNNERVVTVLNTCQFKRASLAEVGDIVLVMRDFRDKKDDMKYGVIKRIQHSGKGNGHYFYVSFKGNDDRNESEWKRYAVNHLFFPDKRTPVILDTKKYYVLKEETCCSVFDDEEPIEIVAVERGIILTECVAGKQPVNKDTMCLSLFDQKDFILETRYNKLFDISYAEANFLVAIDNPGERVRALENREQLEYAIHAKIGDLVHIDGKGNRIVDIGPSREKAGSYFHVTLADPHHPASIDHSKVVPFNRVQFIKEAPENMKSEQEKLEKWAQGDIKDDGKNDSQSSKEIDQRDTKKEKNDRSRSKGCIGKRAFVPEHEICGTVKFQGKPVGGSKLLYGIETDEQLPESHGNYYEGNKLFNCKPNHGIILEGKKVIIEDYTNPEVGKETNNHEDKANSKLSKKENPQWEDFGKQRQNNCVYGNTEGTDVKKRQNYEKKYQTRQSREARKSEELSSTFYRQHTRDDTAMEMGHNTTMQDKLHYHDTEINYLKTSMQINDDKSGFSSKFQSTAMLAQDTQQNHFYEAVGPGDSTNPKSLPQDSFSSDTRKGTSSPQSQLPTSSLGFEGKNYVSMDNLQTTSQPGYKTEENHTNCHNTSFIDDPFDDDSLYADDPHTNHEAELQNTSTPAEKAIHPDLTIGSLVQFYLEGTKIQGVIKWIGCVDGRTEPLAGLELDEEVDFGNDGTYLKKRLFVCPPKRGFFIKLTNLIPDLRFASDIPVDREPDHIVKSYPGRHHPIGDYRKIEGREKGIQGDVNSCYMDATLFTMFACNNVFDKAVMRQKREGDSEEFEAIQKILREEIVNPLRVDGKVERWGVYHLRSKLEKLDNAGGGYLNREKDPEEFINLLFDKLLKMEPLIKLRSYIDGSIVTSHLWQIFVAKDTANQIPSTQYLLESSFLPLGFLEEPPNAMILQLPRHGKEKVFSRIHIQSTINISTVLCNVPQHCIICNENASYFCEHCSCIFGFDKVVAYFCKKCLEAVHKHPNRQNHNKIKPLLEFSAMYEPEPVIMELFAVMCIATSHYVSYVKCGAGDNETWIYFDSMADRVGLENGYNIPEVMLMPSLKEYFNADAAVISDLSRDMKRTDDVTRVFEDASLCFYRR